MEKKLFVEVRYHLKKGQRGIFLQKIQEEGIPEASRNEPGNVRYEYLYSLSDPDELVLLEVWDTAQDQKKHTQLPHYQVLAGLKEQYVEQTELKKAMIEFL